MPPAPAGRVPARREQPRLVVSALSPVWLQRVRPEPLLRVREPVPAVPPWARHPWRPRSSVRRRPSWRLPVSVRPSSQARPVRRLSPTDRWGRLAPLSMEMESPARHSPVPGGNPGALSPGRRRPPRTRPRRAREAPRACRRPVGHRYRDRHRVPPTHRHTRSSPFRRAGLHEPPHEAPAPGRARSRSPSHHRRRRQ